MVWVAEIQILPSEGIVFLEALRERAHQGHERRQVRDALEERTRADVRFDDKPVRALELGDQLLDAADPPPIDVVDTPSDQLLDVDLAAARLFVRHGGHDQGIRLTIARRSHCSSAMMGVFSATRSTRSYGSSRLMREMGMRIGSPRPSPSRLSRRATQLPKRRLRRRASVTGPTST